MTFIPFADHHMHITSSEVAQRMIEKLSREVLGDFVPQQHVADEMIAVLDHAKIGKALALSNAYQWGMDFFDPNPNEYDWVRFENDFTASECAKYPGRLIPFMSIHPLKDYAIEEIDRCVKQLRTRGLKLHFTNSDVDLRKPDQLAKFNRSWPMRKSQIFQC